MRGGAVVGSGGGTESLPLTDVLVVVVVIVDVLLDSFACNVPKIQGPIFCRVPFTVNTSWDSFRESP